MALHVWVLSEPWELMLWLLFAVVSHPQTTAPDTARRSRFNLVAAACAYHVLLTVVLATQGAAGATRHPVGDAGVVRAGCEGEACEHVLVRVESGVQPDALEDLALCGVCGFVWGGGGEGCDTWAKQQMRQARRVRNVPNPSNRLGKNFLVCSPVGGLVLLAAVLNRLAGGALFQCLLTGLTVSVCQKWVKATSP